MNTIQNTISYIFYHPFWFLIISLTVLFIIGRGQFNRRGIGGLQHFSSYSLALIITAIEFLMKWTAKAVLFTAIAGILRQMFTY